MQIFSPEDAILWVDQNAKQIQGHTRKYLPFAPYDQEDFLQDAYEAALEAVNVSADRQIPFPACFWILFKGKVSDVTPNPGSKRNAGSPSPPSTFCDWTDFSRDEFDQATMDDNAESLSSIDIDKVYPLIQHYLTPVEERVLELLLGIHDGPMKIREAARHLDCSPANVRQALNRVCSRLSALVEQGELSLHLVDGEIIKQQFHQEDSVSQPAACPIPMEEVNSIPSEDMEKDQKIRRDCPISQNDSGGQEEANARPRSARKTGSIPSDLRLRKRAESTIWRQTENVMALEEINCSEVRGLCFSEIRPRETLGIAATRKFGSFPSLLAAARQISSPGCRDGPGRFWSDFSPGAHPLARSRSCLAA